MLTTLLGRKVELRSYKNTLLLLGCESFASGLTDFTVLVPQVL